MSSRDTFSEVKFVEDSKFEKKMEIGVREDSERGPRVRDAFQGATGGLF